MQKMKPFAEKLQWLRPLFLLLAIFAFGCFGYGLLQKEPVVHQYLLEIVLLFIWSLLMYNGLGAIGYMPEKPDQSMGFFRRVGRHTRRLYYKLLVLLYLSGLLMLIFLIFRAFRV